LEVPFYEVTVKSMSFHDYILGSILKQKETSKKARKKHNHMALDLTLEIKTSRILCI